MRIGAIEAGGTKMVLALADENGNILERAVVPTTTPAETMGAMAAWFCDRQIDALGIGSFGPVDLNRASETYGYITSTPKQGWAYTDVIGAFKELGVPIGFDTDVNAAVLGEVELGAAQNVGSAVYITVGTGIGAGVYVNGGLLHGLSHAEAGHVVVRPHPDDDFTGICPYHGSCFEGMASGPAIKARWGSPAELLYDRPEVWELESYYIGQAIADYIFTYSPERIVLGGGVMHKDGLLDLVRAAVEREIGGYVRLPDLTTYIVSPGLDENSGIVGAAMLGKRALLERN